ncbi:hypothetical protein Dimus_028756 [Dionaea muscipula]
MLLLLSPQEHPLSLRTLMFHLLKEEKRWHRLLRFVEVRASSSAAVASDLPMVPPSVPTAAPSAPETAPIRPGSPLGRIRRGRQQSPLAGEGSEEKSTDSASLVQKKRKRSAEKVPSGGDEEGIIDMTVGREHELPHDATSQPDHGGEHDSNLSIDDEGLKRFLAGLDSIVVSDDEVQEGAPSKDTAEDAPEKVAEVESETVVSPPKQMKRRLKKAEKEASAETEAVEEGRELVVAPQPPVAPKEGRRTRSKKCETEKKLPSLELPTYLLPTDSPAHTSSAPPKRSVLSSDSMLLSKNKDKEEKQLTRVQWSRECLTAKDKEVAEGLTDVQLRQWLTQASVQQQILWTESLRQQESTNQLIRKYVAEQITYREEGNKKMADAIARAEAATKQEKKALDDFERCKVQLSNMEKNFLTQRNETNSYKAKTEHAADVLKGKETMILSLEDDVDQLKKKNADLERRLKDAEAALAREKEELAGKVKDNEILQADNDRYHAKWKDQEMEELRLKAMIRYNRIQRSELKKSLVAYMADAVSHPTLGGPAYAPWTQPRTAQA